MKERLEQAIKEFLEKEGYLVRMSLLDTEGQENDGYFTIPYIQSKEDGKILELIGRFRIRAEKK